MSGRLPVFAGQRLFAEADGNRTRPPSLPGALVLKEGGGRPVRCGVRAESAIWAARMPEVYLLACSLVRAAFVRPVSKSVSIGWGWGWTCPLTPLAIAVLSC